MRILGILDNRFYLSGVNAYWDSMVDVLDWLGHKVHTLVLDDGSLLWNRQYFDALGGVVHRFQTAPAFTEKRAADLFGEVRPDIVIHHYSDLGLTLSLEAKKHAPLPMWKDVYICHSDDSDHYARVKRRKKGLAHVICVSEVCQDHVIQTFGVRPEDTSLGRYCFVPPKQAVDVARRKSLTASEPGPMGILYAGRLEAYQKRAGDLVPFAEALWKLGVSFRLHIAGSGSLEPMLRDRLSSPAFGQAVVFHGYLAPEALFHLMGEAAIYVSFSEFEGFSTSLVQAMHHGLVPLITPTKSGSDFLEEGKDVLFFDVGDTDAAARQVKALVEAPSRKYRMAERVIQKIARECSPDTFTCQISTFLERLTSASPR